jgi:hypothetical protein
MANMSYCRFENTRDNLRDCLEHINDEDVSKAESKARERLIKICIEIIEDCGGEVETEDLEYPKGEVD